VKRAEDTFMKLQSLLVAFVTIGVLARPAQAQAAADASTPIGVWRGTSLCLVRRSACHDEVVVYRITRAQAGDSLVGELRLPDSTKFRDVRAVRSR
jgi:hypothetical protein